MKMYGNVLVYYDILGRPQVEVKVHDDTVWLMQDQIVDLFQSSKANISEHIKHILAEGELAENSVVRNFRTTGADGKAYNKKYHNLDMIIAIGYRVRSDVGTRFRQWATETLKGYVIKGFVLNDSQLKQTGGGNYFKELLTRIRDIRSSEKVFWRQVLDIYATSIDYDRNASMTLEFFKTVQNKMHWASHGHTAAEIIVQRADAQKPFMGMTSFPGEKPTLQDAAVAKNYLDSKELETLNRIVSLYLDFAELQALDEIPMTMKDWVAQLDDFLKMSRKDILKDGGTVSHENALKKARAEYDKYWANCLGEPTAVERHFIDTIDELKRIEDRE